MKITVIGTGYVGLVTGTCLAEAGNNVLCVDVDEKKIERLNQGIVPIYEPGLDMLIHRNVQAGRLRFSIDIKEGTEHGKLQFIAVGTPSEEETGGADLRFVLQAARTIAESMTEERIIINKSTVPVATAQYVSEVVSQVLEERGVNIPFHVVSNPEFLKEGAAIEDFMQPDRIIVGCDHAPTIRTMQKLFEPFLRGDPNRLIIMDIRSAELTKYATNAMLATRISFMNELANLAELVGADIESVRLGVGSDTRIGPYFLYPGCGYGGSCFPKDVAALQQTAREHGQTLAIVQAVEAVNASQKQRLAQKIMQRLGKDLKGFVLAILGLAFKPNTDDMREAPSIHLIRTLLKRGATLRVYDPVAMSEARKVLGKEIVSKLVWCESALEALDNVDAMVLVTEWQEFSALNPIVMRERMRQALIFDGRNLYNPKEIREAGFEYCGIGRP
ncbi:MAG: UDP-glucose/GDP-mannose dehydrogenase family protein [Pseudomonadota bacterium]